MRCRLPRWDLLNIEEGRLQLLLFLEENLSDVAVLVVQRCQEVSIDLVRTDLDVAAAA